MDIELEKKQTGRRIWQCFLLIFNPDANKIMISDGKM